MKFYAINPTTKTVIAEAQTVNELYELCTAQGETVWMILQEYTPERVLCSNTLRALTEPKMDDDDWDAIAETEAARLRYEQGIAKDYDPEEKFWDDLATHNERFSGDY